MKEADWQKTGRRCLVMMAKFPEAGLVKTRLAADIGHRPAAELYECFIRDLLQHLASDTWSFRLAISPGEKTKETASLFGHELTQIPQRGEGLGDRMENVFHEIFGAGFEYVVLIGSDAPDLPLDFIDEAFTALADQDAVLGPSCDGGYYLVGLRRDGFRKGLFADIPWSTPEVFSMQLRHFRDKGLRAYILPPWRDIDTLADLVALVNLAGATPFSESRTMKYLLAAGLVRHIKTVS